MISWTTIGTAARLTGSTEFVGSSYRSQFGSSTYSAPIAAVGFDYESLLSSTHSESETFQNRTIVSEGKTTYSGETTKFTTDLTYFSESWSGHPQYTYLYSSSTQLVSTSSSIDEETALKQTSTVSTTESSYVITYTTARAAYEYEATMWTTSQIENNGANTSVSFYTTHQSFVTYADTSYSTTQAIFDTVTEISETQTLSKFPDTIVQAETRYADNAEVLYVISSQQTNLQTNNAATGAAQSGSRFTLSPQITTSAKSAVDLFRPTSSIASGGQTSLFSFVNTKTTEENDTSANYGYFPPTTMAFFRNAITTTNTELGTNVLSSQPGFTYGGSIETSSEFGFALLSETVPRRFGNITFHGVIEKTTTWTSKATVSAAVSSSTSSSTSGAYFGSALNRPIGLTSGSSTFESSAVNENTYQQQLQFTVKSGTIGRQKFGTIGAVIHSSHGGWITANASSSGSLIQNDVYALEGSNRRATTMLPGTNGSQTINSQGITWTTSTGAVFSIDGATSKKTTTSALFGVDGATQTTIIGTSLLQFGGKAGPQETFVQTAEPGVYKNRINGSTAFFDGNATVLSNGESAELAYWFPIKYICGYASTTAAAPICWSEWRNSSDAP